MNFNFLHSISTFRIVKTMLKCLIVRRQIEPKSASRFDYFAALQNTTQNFIPFSKIQIRDSTRCDQTSILSI